MHFISSPSFVDYFVFICNNTFQCVLVESMFSTMCDCQALHPDPEDADSDNEEFEGEEYEEEEEQTGKELVKNAFHRSDTFCNSVKVAILYALFPVYVKVRVTSPPSTRMKRVCRT